VLEALKILRARADTDAATLTQADCKVTYIVRGFAGRKRLLLQPSSLHAPNPGCFVCNTEGIDVALDTATMTLGDFVTRVLKGGALPFVNPSVCLNGGGDIVYEEGEDADEELAARNGPKPLAQLPAGGIQHGTVVRVDDAAQELTLDLRVEHRVWAEDDPEAPPEGFRLLGKSVQRSLAAAKSAGEAQARVRAEQQERHAAEEAVKASLRGKKRPVSGEGEGEGPAGGEEQGQGQGQEANNKKKKARMEGATAAAAVGGDGGGGGDDDDAICIVDDDGDEGELGGKGQGKTNGGAGAAVTAAATATANAAATAAANGDEDLEMVVIE
jgi:hypothetical protein